LFCVRCHNCRVSKPRSWPDPIRPALAIAHRSLHEKHHRVSTRLRGRLGTGRGRVSTDPDLRCLGELVNGRYSAHPALQARPSPTPKNASASPARVWRGGPREMQPSFESQIVAHLGGKSEVRHHSNRNQAIRSPKARHLEFAAHGLKCQPRDDERKRCFHPLGRVA
jgi:hypothetical protein